MDIETEEGLDLSLSLRQYSPPRSQPVFACGYCPAKFRSPQALGGHQNAHKLERHLSRRAMGLSSVAAGLLGKAAGDDHRAPLRPGAHACGALAWGAGGRIHPRRHRQQGTGTGAGAASSGTRRGSEELADEAIDLR
nr:zinc finger protein 4-like [Aegilops tauschii subsp. strangulata]